MLCREATAGSLWGKKWRQKISSKLIFSGLVWRNKRFTAYKIWTGPQNMLRSRALLSKRLVWKTYCESTVRFKGFLGVDFWEGDATKHFSVDKRIFSENGGRHSVNEAFGKDLYNQRRGRSKPFSELPDSENWEIAVLIPFPKISFYFPWGQGLRSGPVRSEIEAFACATSNPLSPKWGQLRGSSTSF